MTSAVINAGIGCPDMPNYVGGKPIGVNGPTLWTQTKKITTKWTTTGR